MLMKCPFCGRPHDGSPRCPQCQQRLTEWMNWDAYAEQAGEIARTERAAERSGSALSSLERATVFDPESPHRFAQLGMALIDAREICRAEFVLEFARSRFPKSPELTEFSDRLNGLSPQESSDTTS